MPSILMAAAKAGAGYAGTFRCGCHSGWAFFLKLAERHFPERKESVLSVSVPFGMANLMTHAMAHGCEAKGFWRSRSRRCFRFVRRAGLRRQGPGLAVSAFRVPASTGAVARMFPF